MECVEEQCADTESGDGDKRLVVLILVGCLRLASETERCKHSVSCSSVSKDEDIQNEWLSDTSLHAHETVPSIEGDTINQARREETGN